MIVLFDADSLVWASCYNANDDLEEAKMKYEDSFNSILSRLSEYDLDIDSVITFNNSKGNFRKILDPNYKANRKGSVLPEILEELHQHIKEEYGGISGFGIETDDLIARYWNHIAKERGRDKVIIVALDKDYISYQHTYIIIITIIYVYIIFQNKKHYIIFILKWWLETR